MENRYLIHHGVKGQKWGVINNTDTSGSGSFNKKKKKSYVNKDGSYDTSTLRGKYKNWNQKANAKRVIQSNANYAKSAASAHARYADKLDKQSEKLSAKSQKLRDSGKTEKADKAATKASKKSVESEIYRMYGEAYAKRQDTLNKYLSDVKSETKKAGRDYVYKSEWYGNSNTNSVIDNKSGDTVASVKTSYYVY